MTTTSSTTSTTGCPARLTFHTGTGTTSCGGATISPDAAPPWTGAIYDNTTGTGTPLRHLGQSCLYVGGGGNTSTPPNANPDGPDTIFGVSKCEGNTVHLQGHAGSGALAGNSNGWGGNPIRVDCSLGPYATKHCTRTNAPCTTDDDCALGSTGLCNPDPRCLFGPPLPVPGGTPTCVVNVFRSDASGSILDKTIGDSNISLPLSSYIYLTQASQKFCKNGADGVAGAGTANPRGICTGDANCTDLPGSTGACQTEPPCPLCINTGTLLNHCWTGQNHGQPCIPVGSKLTTADCLPRPNPDFTGPLTVTLAPLGTGTTTLTGVPNPLAGQAPINYLFCPTDGTAGTCTPQALSKLGSTCQRSGGAFGQKTAKFISESGEKAGDLTDYAAHSVTIAAVFCIPGSGSQLVDGGAGADLPGPGAVSIRGTFQFSSTP